MSRIRLLLTRPPVAALCAALLAVTVVVTAPRAVRADDSNRARVLLERSRDAASGTEYSGTMVVEWQAGGKARERQVAVRVSDGVVHMGNDRLVSGGARSFLRTDNGWRLLWDGAATSSIPDPARKYRFTVKSTTAVAHRPTTQVAISRAGSKDVRERLFFDNASGLLLRRDQLDDRGRLVRRVAFVKITDPTPAAGFDANDLPKVGKQSPDAAPQSLKTVPDDLSAPKKIGDGFVLAGVYDQADGSTQLYYSDGLLGLSVFESTGELAWDSLPAGGRTVEIGDVRARVYSTAAGTAAVWGHDDVVYTCVTDATLDEVQKIAADFPKPDDGGPLEEIGRFVTAPFSWS